MIKQDSSKTTLTEMDGKSWLNYSCCHSSLYRKEGSSKAWYLFVIEVTAKIPREECKQGLSAEHRLAGQLTNRCPGTTTLQWPCVGHALQVVFYSFSGTDFLRANVRGHFLSAQHSKRFFSENVAQDQDWYLLSISCYL